MSFIEPKNLKIIPDINSEIASVAGIIDEEQSKILLSKFLAGNLSYMMKLMTGAAGKGIELYPFQEILLKMLLEKDNVLCVMARGVGKCLSYSNPQYLIEENNGLSLLKSLLPNLTFTKDEELEDIKELKLWNGKSWQTTSKILKQSKKDCAKIITSQGYSLSGSTNHLIKVLDEKLCKIVWKRYNELLLGDKVCIDRSQPEWELEIIEDDEAYFVGLLLGDGCITKKSYDISSADKEIIDFCVQQYDCTVVSDKRSTCNSIRINTKISQYYKQKYDLNEELSYNKKIPQRILKSKSAIKNCLRGLFDTDGSIQLKQFSIDFCSTSQEMAEQVHLILLTFGIISKLRLKKTNSKFGKAWIVSMTGENAVNFIQNIGFRLNRKNQIGLNYINQKKNINTNLNVVHGAKIKIKDLKKNLKLEGKLSEEWYHKIRRGSQQKEISYKRLGYTLDFLQRCNIKEDLIKDLLKIQNTNFFFDPVVSIEKFQDNCIDFCDIPNGNAYWSNGFLSHNTTIAIWFIIIYCILYPKSKIGILAPTFRKTRDIFKGIQDISNQKGAELLRQCIGKEKCNPDLNWLQIGSSEVFALPLGASGDKIRGYRFNVVILDEAGFVPEKIITSVIIPFLSTETDPIEKQRSRERETDLISRGLMKESERIVYKNNKFLAFSSATYQFEHLYTMYKNYKEAILNPPNDQLASYGIFQMSYEAAPDGLLNLASTENAKNSMSSQEFNKEYRAMFPADSDGYFKMEKMEKCTIPLGQEPAIEIRGEKNAKYLVAIDPNSMSDASTADHFSISVFKLNEKDQITILVHQFAACELNIADYTWYFLYILKEFNVVCITIDRSGSQFIEICNNSEIFKNAGMELQFFEGDFEVDPKDYVKELNRARRSYNLSSRKIVYSQYFFNDWKRKANEILQNCIEYKKILFAAEPGDTLFESMLNTNITNFDKLKFHSGEETGSDKDARKIDFIDHQKFLMKDVKHQCSLIELDVSGQGTHRFELPSNLRRIRGEGQIRRDSYTCLYLGVYMAKRYFDMFSDDEKFNFNTAWKPYVI